MGFDHLVRDLFDHVFEHEAEVATCAKICWSDMSDAIGVRGQLVALLE